MLPPERSPERTFYNPTSFHLTGYEVNNRSATELLNHPSHRTFAYHKSQTYETH